MNNNNSKQKNKQYEYIIDERYSFIIQSGENQDSQTYYFTLQKAEQLNEEFKPVKLGDGTYGIVFQVHDSAKNTFAVKLLYDKFDEQILNDSYEEEMTSAKNIREKLTSNKSELEFEGVINIIGGTPKFKTSKIYENHHNFFENLRVSDYAIVMPKYNQTLKDVLEENQVSQIDKEKKQAGYRIIQTWSFPERIKQILPYLRSIAEGISTLHEVGKFHLDLKPSNIFVNLQRQKFDVVIGDLGFLNYQKRTSSELYNVHENLPLGTRHYRSPEQKEFFDICDAKIVSIGNGKIELEIKDLKFKDTIVEKQDLICFSKVGNSQLTVANIDNSEENSIKITTKIAAEENNILVRTLQENEITQVTFYKKQEVRTDLFGFAAIAFDMLTGGKSPERFYDNIRSYDLENEDVNTIIDLYKQVFDLQSDRPDLIRLFEPFKRTERSTDYAPYDIVGLILKCMLYKAKNTYYNQSQKNNDQNENISSPIKLVIEDLKKLKTQYSSEVEDNLVIKGVSHNKIRESGKLNTLEEQLYEIQDLLTDYFPARLLLGFGYYNHLVNLVDNIIRIEPSESNNNDFIFADLRPNNIIIDPSNNNNESVSLRESSYVYRQYLDYKNDLIDDYVYAKIRHDISNPFIPNYLAFMRRKISLKKIDSESDNPLRFYYSFDDYSAIGDSIKKGDWIVEIQNGNSSKEKILWQIDKFEDNWIEIKNFDNLLENQFQNIDIQSDLVFYSNIDTLEYYVHMIGVYIYQIFFKNIGNNYGNTIYPINLIEIACNVYKEDTIKLDITQINNYEEEYFDNSHNLGSLGKPKILELILNKLTSIYIKCIISGFTFSYYKFKKNEAAIRIIRKIKDDNIILSRLIYAFFENEGQDNDKLLKYINSFEKILTQFEINQVPKLSDYKSKGHKQDYQIPDFNDLINHNLQFSSRQQTKRFLGRFLGQVWNFLT